MLLAATADLAALDAISIKLPPALEIMNISDPLAARTAPCPDDVAHGSRQTYRRGPPLES